MVPDLGHVHAHDGPLQQSHKGFQGATPRTRPLAPLPSWPPGLRLNGQPTTARGLQFLDAQSRAPLLSNPQGASQRLCRRPAHPALRVFYTPMHVLYECHLDIPRNCTGSLPSHGYPQPAWAAQLILSPARLVPTTPHTRQGLMW